MRETRFSCEKNSDEWLTVKASGDNVRIGFVTTGHREDEWVNLTQVDAELFVSAVLAAVGGVHSSREDNKQL